MPFEPMQAYVSHWHSKIVSAFDAKGKRFQKDADDGMKFFAGPYDFLYEKAAKKDDQRGFRQVDDDDDGAVPAPRFQMTLNKTAELVQIFGPVLYHRNPNRMVTPREFPLPGGDMMSVFGQDPATMMMLQQATVQGQQLRAIDSIRSKILEYYLNYTPNALDLKTESRWAIVETLVKGGGCLWTEKYTPPSGGPSMIGSFYDSVANLLIDPDAKSLNEAMWIARRVCEPVWRAERKFNLPPGTLKGVMESAANKAAVDSHPEGPYLRATGQTCDLIVYYEVYSKCGLGGRLTGIDPSYLAESERYGDFCYLAICNGVSHPLNIPPQLFDLPYETAFQEIYSRIQWPIPYWADGTWPLSFLGFHWIPEDPWPMSHMAPAMGELKFLNWAYSMIAGKMRISLRDFIVFLEEAGPDVENAVLRGSDYERIKIKGSGGKSIGELVQFLQHPQFNFDIWKVIEAVSEQFEKRVGLTELSYGVSRRQDRSATESATKRDQMNIRPEDMANRVEDWMGEVARKEAIAARFLLTGRDVQQIVGPTGAMMWDQFITPSNPAELLYSLEYRIEAGSVRKPNREKQAQNAKDLFTAMAPFYQQVALSTGVTAPWNELVTLYCNANDMKPDRLLLPNITTPPPMPAAPQGSQPA